MKKFIYLTLMNLLFISSLAFAQPSTDTNGNNGNNHNAYNGTDKNTNVQWVCTTNASSGKNADETTADETMKKPNEANAAFNFALTNCRDCTKITCTHE